MIASRKSSEVARTRSRELHAVHSDPSSIISADGCSSSKVATPPRAAKAAGRPPISQPPNLPPKADRPNPKAALEEAIKKRGERASLGTDDSEEDTESEGLRMSRTNSAQSLPATTSSTLSAYERAMMALSNDVVCQKEVSLGRRVGLYRLGKELGEGNFSKVKLGVHILAREKVAVKIMDKTKLDKKARRLLAREIEAMEKVHHPNIIRLFECIETLTRFHLVMEYAGGGELYTYVHERGKLAEDETKLLFGQLVAAVAHLHDKKIVHRDIKAENVIFSAPGWVKLADFGFSCCHNDEQLMTFCGSPPYAAPELFRDEHYDGPMVDIWALGVLLYFMLVGVTPFRGSTVSELKATILTGEYNAPDYLNTFAVHMIKMMLEVDTKKRMTINDVKRTFWLRGNKLPRSYMQCSSVPDAEELARSELARKVASTLHQYGISNEMLAEAQTRGAYDSVIGTYRIVLYQAQSADVDKEIQRTISHPAKQASIEKMNREVHMLKSRSRTCVIA